MQMMRDPLFSATKPKHDLSTFTGRLMHFIDITEPSTLFSSDEKVLESKMILARYKATGCLCGTDSDMWSHRKLVDAAIHPISGEIIPKPFRVSAIAPINIPIVFGMLICPASNVIGTMGLHWINQSYNTACNYCNRSGNAQTFEQMVTSYILAVTSACTFAFGLGKLYERAPLHIKKYGGFVIPLFATSAANISNISLTRADEIMNGVPVKDSSNNVVGVSKIAGIQGVIQSAVTRCVLVPFSCLCLPPLFMGLFKMLNILPKHPKAALLVELGVIYASLQAALPGALAVYPQTASFEPEQLEKSFHHLSGKGLLFANKGL